MNLIMNQSVLRRLAARILEDGLLEVGFHLVDSAYVRELSSGVIHIILIGLDARSKETFQVLCGVNTRQIVGDEKPQAMGVFGGQHLTKKGWCVNSGRWGCRTEEEAIESLGRVRALCLELADPWLSQFQTLSSVAHILSDDQQGIVKARLFVADGNIVGARESLLSYRRRLSQPKEWDNPKFLEKEKAEVESLLQAISDT